MLKKLIHRDELWIGEQQGFVIDGVAIVLVHSDLGFSAFHNRCPHAGALMSEGFFDGSVLTCARHFWQFDAYTGKGLNPINAALQPFPIIIDKEGMIWIELGGEN